jgi:hypothetical protein
LVLYLKMKIIPLVEIISLFAFFSNLINKIIMNNFNSSIVINFGIPVKLSYLKMKIIYL